MAVTFRADKSQRESDVTIVLAFDGDTQEELQKPDMRVTINNAATQYGFAGAAQSNNPEIVPISEGTDEPFTNDDLKPGNLPTRKCFRAYIRMQRH